MYLSIAIYLYSEKNIIIISNIMALFTIFFSEGGGIQKIKFKEKNIIWIEKKNGVWSQYLLYPVIGLYYVSIRKLNILSSLDFNWVVYFIIIFNFKMDDDYVRLSIIITQ